jgi:hypothetical protein
MDCRKMKFPVGNESPHRLPLTGVGGAYVQSAFWDPSLAVLILYITVGYRLREVYRSTRHVLNIENIDMVFLVSLEAFLPPSEIG